MDTVTLVILIVVVIIVLLVLLLWYQSRQSPKAAEGGHKTIERSAAPVETIPQAAPVQPEPVVVSDESLVVESVVVAPDDLKIIEGIGPKIQSILNEAGILTFSQLAASDPVQLKQTLEAAGLRLGDPTTWPEQAKLAAEGKLDELKALQDQLTGGRKA